MKKNLTTLEGMREQPRLEFLYLRDNYLTSWSDIGMLNGLKILDIGNNSFTGLSFLESAPNLRQLYANCNNLLSLADLPALPYLEHLSVSHNSIESLLGMPALPSLRGLCLTGNSLESFIGFPHLPQLEFIRLADNPVTATPSCDDPAAPTWRQMVLALVGPTLFKIDGEKVDEADYGLVAGLPAMLAPALQAGYVVGNGLPDDERSFSDPEKLLDDIRGYILNAQRAELINTPHPLASLDIELTDGTVIEDRPVVGSATLEDDDNLTTRVQWYRWVKAEGDFVPIDGATDAKYTPVQADVGTTLRFEVLALDGDEAFRTVFQLTPDVMEAEPLAKSLTIAGHPMETETLTIDRGYVGGKEAIHTHPTLPYSTVTWRRVHPDTGDREDVRTGALADCMTYSLGLEDIGCVIEAEYSVARVDGITGNTLTAASPRPVKAAKPSVRNVTVTPEEPDASPEAGYMEQAPLRGDGDYYGGRPGLILRRWYREAAPATPRSRARAHREGRSTAPAGDPTLDVWEPIDGATEPVHIPTLADVGRHLLFEFTPVSSDGEVGVPRTAVTPVIRPAHPVLLEPVVGGECVEAAVLTAGGMYVGGHEGASSIQWFVEAGKSKAGTPKFARIPNATGRTFTPAKVHIGRFVSVKYTPVRDDGTRGDMVSAVSPRPIEAALPSIKCTVKAFSPVQGATIAIAHQYLGGSEGPTVVTWYRSAPGLETCPSPSDAAAWTAARDPVSVTGRTASDFRATVDEIACWLMAEVQPVRDDGARGEPVRLTMPEPMAAADPTFERFAFDGDLVEGQRVTLAPKYHGGVPGAHEIEWRAFTDATDDAGRVLSRDDVLEVGEDGVTLSMVIGIQHVGWSFAAKGRPVRADGAAGKPYTIPRTSPVAFGAPTVSLALEGRAVEGEPLQLTKTYLGGIEGVSRLRWFSVADPDAAAPKPEPGRVTEELLTYTIQPSDVGRHVVAEYTPVRADGAVGHPTRAVVGPILPSDPMIADLRLEGALEEGQPIGREYVYTGGKEGASRHVWSTRPPPTDTDPDPEWVQASTDPDWAPTLAHIGHQVHLIVHPTRSDGEEGEPGLATSGDRTITATGPRAEDVHLVPVTDVKGMFRLEYTYRGGQEGESSFRWHRTTTVGSKTRSAIKGATRRMYRATKKDLNCLLSAQVLPVRADGVKGEKVMSNKTPKIPADIDFAEPSVVDIELPAPLESSPCTVQAMFGNCTPESCTFAWSITKDGETTDLPETGPSYTPTLDQVGGTLAVVCTPRDLEGIVGAMQPGATSIPIAFGPPRVVLQYLSGGVIGEDAVFSYTYTGATEGASRVTWFRAAPGTAEWTEAYTMPAAPVDGELRLPLTADDRDHVVRVAVTPVRDDGVEGTPVEADVNDLTPVKVSEATEAKVLAAVTEAEAVFPVVLRDTKDDQRSIVIEHGKLKVRKGRKTREKVAVGPDTEVRILGGLGLVLVLSKSSTITCDAVDAQARNVLALAIAHLKEEGSPTAKGKKAKQ